MDNCAICPARHRILLECHRILFVSVSRDGFSVSWDICNTSCMSWDTFCMLWDFTS